MKKQDNLERLREITARMSTEQLGNPMDLAAFAIGMIEAAPDAIVVADAKGVIVMLNTKAEELFGYQRPELIGTLTDRLVPERFLMEHVAARDRFPSHPRVRSYGAEAGLCCLTKSGEEVPIEVSLGPMATGRGLYVIAFIRRRGEPHADQGRLADPGTGTPPGDG